jgi:hemerythrin superfamily protein
MEILDCMKADHMRIRTILAELTSEFASPEWKYRLFRDVSLLVESHAKAKEATLLRYAREISEENMDVRAMIYKSYEKHALMEELVQKIRVTEDPEAWEAKVSVYCDWLELHLKEEEEVLFPELEARLEAVEGLQLGETYLRLREIGMGHDPAHQLRFLSVV